jgi:hypothetical protein
MAYTIKFNRDSNNTIKRDRVLAYLQARLIKDGRFRATLTPISVVGFSGKSFAAIRIKPVRLVTAKPYCGNHPGPCPVSNKPKPRATYLEWEDWIQFHNLINKALNRFRADADVWSTPQDVKGKMWIRKGICARLRYDWEESFQMGRMIRIWNQGTEDQFQ